MNIFLYIVYLKRRILEFGVCNNLDDECGRICLIHSKIYSDVKASKLTLK